MSLFTPRTVAHLGIVCLIVLTAPLSQANAFSHANGYYSLAGDAGVITGLRLDATGQGHYGANTIAAGGHLGYLCDGALVTGSSAQAAVQDNKLTITGLPTGMTLTVTLINDVMEVRLDFSGTHTIRQEWDLVYLDDGFYQRATGQNYFPDATLEMPFESFYDTATGIFRPIEHLKKSAGQLLTLGWAQTYCRGRLNNDIRYKCFGNGGTLKMNLQPQANKLTLINEGSLNTYVRTNFKLLPKCYSTTLDVNNPLPEFYVLPEEKIHPFSDTSVTNNASDLLTELFQQSAYWSGSAGYGWSDWSMMPRAFTVTDEKKNLCLGSLGWVVSHDGFGHDGYAYSWGSNAGWPFPDDKDARHFDMNPIYINAVWRYLVWTGDTSVLSKGPHDHVVSIDYGNGNVSTVPTIWPSATSYLCQGMTLGQTFKATAPFSKIGAMCVNWSGAGAGFTLKLFNRAGGTMIASTDFKDVVGAQIYSLTIPVQPAGDYYLEMSNPIGTVGWYGDQDDTYGGGQAYQDGKPALTLLERLRLLMKYQQEVLNGNAENLIVLGNNIGSPDHQGRPAIDVGSNYYDILPFGNKDAFDNVHYYNSVRAMADIEALAGNGPQSAAYWIHLDAVRAKYNATFWRTGLDRDQSARYIGCVDANGHDHDYGFSFINTFAVDSGLTQGYPDRTRAIFKWLDTGESQHSDPFRDYVVRIGYVGRTAQLNADLNRGDCVPQQLTSGHVLAQRFFAAQPFTSAASYNPTWMTANAQFKLSMYALPTRRLIAQQTFINVMDNSFNELTFAQQPAGFYSLEMSNPTGQIGWESSPWVSDIYAHWLFAPRVSARNNTNWWAYPVGSGYKPDSLYNPAAPDFVWRWDLQLQNGGADLYESGYDVMGRAKYYDAGSAWRRLRTILQRYSDPDRLCSKNTGFYGEAIQGDGQAGSVGWMRSEFPETGVLGSAFFLGFFGIEPTVDGLRITPHIPESEGITTLGARNIAYQEALFNLEATTTSVRVVCTRNSKNKTFYMGGGISAAGSFNVSAPLENGAMVLSIKPQPAKTCAMHWMLYNSLEFTVF